MAPTHLRHGILVAALLAACGTSAGEPRAPRPPAATPTIAPATPAVPDLSAARIDCDVVDGPCEPGDDATLDLLWDACADDDPDACDRLYYDAPFDSRFEQFGNTCGDRGVLVPCEDHVPLAPPTAGAGGTRR